MFKLLLEKEWKEHIRIKWLKNKKNLIGFFFKIIVLAGFITTFLYLFLSLNERFRYYMVDNELLIFSLFFIFVLEIVVGLGRGTKVLFDASDKELIIPTPLKEKEIILSKIVILYIQELLGLIKYVFPILIAYGVVSKVGISYYILMCIIPFLMAFMTTIIIALLSIPFVIIRNFLRQYPIMQVIWAILLIAIIGIAYQTILNIFIGLIKNDDLSYLFNNKNVAIMRQISKYLIPINWVGNLLTSNQVLTSILLIILYSGILFILMLFISFRFYRYITKKKLQGYIRIRHGKNKIVHPIWSLIKKELLNIFRNSNYIFSYISVLLMFPFITYIICDSLKPLVVFYFSAKNFLPFAILIVSVFGTVINSTSSLSISQEKQNLMILKVIPASYKTQIMVKLGINTFLSTLSLVVTGMVLFLTDVTSLKETLIIVLIAWLLVTSLILVNMIQDLKHPSLHLDENSDSKNLTFALLLSIILPVILFILALITYMLFENLKMTILLYLLIEMIVFVFSFLGLYLNINRLFRKVAL